MYKPEYESREQLVQAFGDWSGTQAVQCYRQFGNGKHTGHIATTEHIPRPCKAAVLCGASEGATVTSPRSNHLNGTHRASAPRANDERPRGRRVNENSSRLLMPRTK